MGYRAGIDIGTTFTAAAVWHDGRDEPEIVVLGRHDAAVPTIVAIEPDGHVLFGEAAERRAVEHPTLVVREFKRRVGDPVPFVIGGMPWSAGALMAQALTAVIGELSIRFGEAPTSITLTHPAGWGAYRLEHFLAVAGLAGSGSMELVPEPVAAAVHFLATHECPVGSTLAIYDLGGGTFDATIVRVGCNGPEVVGTAEGLDHLGGLDVDAAVLDHVRRSIPGMFAELDADDLSTASRLDALRESCRRAKEALSEEVRTAVLVALPSGAHTVTMTRSELEAATAHLVLRTLETMERAILGAGLTKDDIDQVVLVGGATRMPAIAAAVSGRLGRPVAVDTHPKHSVALGAARTATRTPASVPAATSAATAELRLDDTRSAPAPTVVDAGARRRPAPSTLRRSAAALALAVVLAGSAVAAIVSSDGGGAAATGSDGTRTAEPLTPALTEPLSRPVGVASHPFRGRVLIAETSGDQIVAVNDDGSISLIAGTGDSGFSGDGGRAPLAEVDAPAQLAASTDGRIAFADTANHRIRIIDSEGVIDTALIYGSGVIGAEGGTAGASAAEIGLAFDESGRLLVADRAAGMVRAILPDGTVIVVAGTGATGFGGDGGPAYAALLDRPGAIATDEDGRILVVDTGNGRIRAIGTDGRISTILGDGGGEVAAELEDVTHLGVHPDGRLLLVESSRHRVRAVAPDGTVTTVAGTGAAGRGAFGEPASETALDSPSAVVAFTDGTMLIADTGNNQVVQIAADGTLQPFAGESA